jgi:hypothetical protein
MVSNGYFPQLTLPSTLWEKELGFPVGLQPPKRGSLDKLICPWPTNLRGLIECCDRPVC